VMLLGHGIAVLLGAAIGAVSKNQMMARYVFSGQLHLMINSIGNIQADAESIGILTGNIALVAAAFLVAYKRAFAK